jgi:hypothetical protein
MDMMGKDRKPLGLLAVLAVSAILVSAVLAVNADAARGAGKGGGKHGSGTTNTGFCVATPNPLALGADVTISGSGFPANSSIGYTLSSSSATGAGWVVTGDTGDFSLTGSIWWQGTVTFTASDGTTSATCSFEVV